MYKLNFLSTPNVPVNPGRPTNVKTIYSCLHQALEDYQKDERSLYKMGEMRIKNSREYADFVQADHSKEGAHYRVFKPISLLLDYVMHNGAFSPVKEKNVLPLVTAISKSCTMKDEPHHLELGMIQDMNANRKIPAFFTESFFDAFEDITHFNRSMFFTNTVLTDYPEFNITDRGDVFWLFEEGLATGWYQCGLPVFNDFTDMFKYPEEKLSEDEWEDLWTNIYIKTGKL